MEVSTAKSLINGEKIQSAEGGQERTGGQGRVAVLHLPLAHLHITCGSRSNIFCISQEQGKMYIIYDHLWSRIYRMPESGTSTNTQRCKTDAECIPNLQSLVQGVICSTRARWNLRTKPLASWRWCWLSYQSVWDLSTSVTRINSVTELHPILVTFSEALHALPSRWTTGFSQDLRPISSPPRSVILPSFDTSTHPSATQTCTGLRRHIHWIDHVNQDH